MIFDRYKIHYVDLTRDLEPIDDSQGDGQYCVFWAKSIPLGHAFLSAREAASAEGLANAARQAIKPAMSGYCESADEQLSGRLDEVVRRIPASVHPASIPTQCNVSVVICTRNRADSLRNCLSALSRQRCAPKEIIVVDNASVTMATKRAVLEFPGVRYVREERPGLDIARNCGAREATCDVVAYTDDDTLPDELWVYRIYETFRRSEIAAMTGLVLAGSLDTEAEVIFEKFWPFNRGYVARTYDRQFFDATLPDGPPVWEIGAGANMAFRRDLFEEVGYFDERLDVGAAGCSGDSEMWYRILANGYRIAYNPLAVVQHFHRTSIEGLKRQLYSYMKGFTVAILIQHQRFGHRGNLLHLFWVLPFYYLGLIRKGFPHYNFQYKTLFSEIRGIFAGMFYFLRHRNTDPRIHNWS